MTDFFGGGTNRASTGVGEEGHPIGRPKAVLFDCGNTILNPNPEVVRRVLAPAGLDVWAQPLTEVLGLVADLHAIDLPSSASEESFYVWWRRLTGIPNALGDDLLRTITLQPDLYSLLNNEALPALELIRAQGIKIAVVANAEGQTRREIQDFGLSALVDVVVDSFDLGARKPEAEIFVEAGRLLDVNLGDCWFIGDALINDVLGALRAGVDRAFLYDPAGLFMRLPIDRVSSLLDFAEIAS